MRGMLPRPAMSPLPAVTGATRVCELAAARRAAFWLPGTTAAPVRDSTGASSSLTLEQADSAAAAARVRRYLWVDLMLRSFAEMRALERPPSLSPERAPHRLAQIGRRRRQASLDLAIERGRHQ